MSLATGIAEAPELRSGERPGADAAESSAQSAARGRADALSGWRELLFGPTALSVLDQAVFSGTNFLTNLVLIRALAPADYGIYALAWSLALFLRSLQEPLLCAPYMVYAPAKPEEQRESYRGSVLAHQLFFGLTAGGLTLAGIGGAQLVAGGDSAFLPAGAAGVLGLLAPLLPIMLLRDFARTFAFAQLNVPLALAVDVAVAVVQLALLAALLATGGISAATGLFAVGIACGAAAIVWLFFKQERMAFSWTAILGDWCDNWTFARWTLGSQLLSSTMPLLLPWILAWGPGGANSTALLSAGAMLVGVVNMFVVGVSNYLTNRAIHAYREEGVAGLGRVLRSTTLLFAATVGLFAIAACFGGQWAADLLFRGKYPEAGPVLGWLAFTALATSMNIAAGNGLWALERPQANFAADVVSLLATLAATLVCVPLWGPAGAAAATCLGQTLAAIVRGLALQAALAEASAGEAAA